jgi:hypothetical protein
VPDHILYCTAVSSVRFWTVVPTVAARSSLSSTNFRIVPADSPWTSFYRFRPLLGTPVFGQKAPLGALLGPVGGASARTPSPPKGAVTSPVPDGIVLQTPAGSPVYPFRSSIKARPIRPLWPLAGERPRPLRCSWSAVMARGTAGMGFGRIQGLYPWQPGALFSNVETEASGRRTRRLTSRTPLPAWGDLRTAISGRSVPVLREEGVEARIPPVHRNL